MDNFYDHDEIENENNTIYTNIINTYWIDNTYRFINNIIYDSEQITNNQYHRIINFLTAFR